MLACARGRRRFRLYRASSAAMDEADSSGHPVVMLERIGDSSVVSRPVSRAPAMGVVTAVSRNSTHSFGKPNQPAIEVVAGLGVKDDAHLGETVQHVVRVREN